MSEPLTFDRANSVQRALRRFVATGLGSWLGARILQRIDGPAFRLSRGRWTASSLLAGLPVVLLTTTGARSGKPRTVPLLGFPTSDGLVVIASNFGRPSHPAWYFNLRSHPECEVAVDGTTRRVIALEAEGAARERIWRQGLAIYPGWSQYERRAATRRIAVLVLEPA